MYAFRSNLKLGLRNLRNKATSTSLNILGLTLGVMGAIIIFLTVRYETSFDDFHNHHKEIYRVTNNYYYPTFTMYVGQTPYPMAEALQNEFSEFTNIANISSTNDHAISVEEQTYESDILFCGPEFIKMFDYFNNPAVWTFGNPNDILNDINKTILTESLAQTLFGNTTNAIGKIIKLNDETPLEVAGIIQDPPNNTNYPFEQLVSRSTYEQGRELSFNNVSSTTTFVQLPENMDPKSLQPAVDEFNEKYMEAAWGEDFVSMALQPLTEIHYDERFGSNNYTTGKAYLWALSLIGFFLVLIACINFINLSTAKALRRSKEIGIKKILGSTKKQIIMQFMVEASLLSSISIFLGILLAQLSFPIFSELTNLNIGNNFTYNPTLVWFLLGLLVFIPFAMGLYPAFMLARFKSLDIVQQKKNLSLGKGINLRRALITFQLSTSQIMVIGAIVIAYQLHYFQNKDLGFSEESVLAIDFHGTEPVEKQIALKNKILDLSFVKTASLNSAIPMTGHHSSSGLTSIDSEVKERFNVQYIYVDNDYVDAMDLELLAGKKSITNIDQDTIRGFVVNETLVNRLGFGSPQDAIGKRINMHGYQDRIIGVVKDFHSLSLHEAIKPIGMIYGIRDYSTLGIKYQTDNIQGTIAQLEDTWNNLFPDKSFNYYFVDDRMANFYENEVRFSRIINAFTLISLFIACIGLIGLSAFSSLNRYKEIGIRKVLGATVSQILVLLSREFVLLACIGFIIGTPIAYLLSKFWLESFAYSINLEWWMLLMAGVLTLLVTLLTVGVQSIKAATLNPVQSLKTE